MYLTTDEPIATLQDAVSATALAAGRMTAYAEQDAPDVDTEMAAEVVWGLITGQLRGRIPYPVPYDLLAVAVSAAIRWSQYVGNAETVQIHGTEVVGFGGRPQFVGFLLSELIVLWRYRGRTA